uniref:WD repeat-containing protein 79 n=1 Tax=Stomoxys calcitrans TaxID=35570 RepID=A0A1I8NMM6_STOCA
MDCSDRLNTAEYRSSLSLFSAGEEDASVLNNNAKICSLDLTLPTENDTLEEEASTNITVPKLSITMDQEEKELLKQQKGRHLRSDSLLRELSNTSGHFNKSISTQETDKNDTETTNKSNDSRGNDKEGESIIPVEDEQTADESTLKDSSVENIERQMFSHLQPGKQNLTTEAPMEVENDAANEKEEIQEESYIEEDPLETMPDESQFFRNPFIELGRRLWKSNDQKQCYTKGCLWSPDGTCLLVPIHMDGMHVIELPTDLYTMQEIDTNRELSALSTAVHVKEGGMVYDCSWYPFMNSTDPATCCWLATRQHEPIQMWDAFTGELRCSYRGYDDVDEVEAAISIAFSNDGQKVVGGYKKNIKIFDTNIPGREYTTVPVKQTVSCFAFTNQNDNCVTTGSWNSHIYHYDLRAPKLGPLFVLGDHTGGITWLKYSSYNTDSWYLFSGARRDDRILKWDMRNYQQPVTTFKRNVSTNQRIYFDLSPMHKWLISGDTKGLLRIWDTDGNMNEENLQIPLHSDCCNGVSFHPSLPILSTSSGQFHFNDIDGNLRKSSDNAIEKVISYENSVLFLWFGPSKPAV